MTTHTTTLDQDFAEYRRLSRQLDVLAVVKFVAIAVAVVCFALAIAAG